MVKQLEYGSATNMPAKVSEIGTLLVQRALRKTACFIDRFLVGERGPNGMVQRNMTIEVRIHQETKLVSYFNSNFC